MEEAAWLKEERSRFEELIAHKLFGPPKPKPKVEVVASKTKKPWYKKWWVYTAIGGVVAIGAATGIGLYFSLRKDETDVVVHY